MYINSVAQAGMTGQVQYVVLPAHSSVSQIRPVLQGQGYAGQAVPQTASPQQYQSYVVSPTQTPYQQFPYGAISKDVTSSVIQQHPRSQTPPTPPQTASPVVASQFLQQQQLTLSSQIPAQSPQQSHTSPYQQQTTSPHTPQQVMRPMVPVVIQGGRGVTMATAVGQPNPIPSQYPQPPAHVQTQYPSNQRRMYNIDRRVPKAGEMYGSEAVMQGSSLVSYGDGTIPTGYEIPGDRSQYNFQFQRYIHSCVYTHNILWVLLQEALHLGPLHMSPTRLTVPARFPLGFIWEISARFPTWDMAKDPGDEFWRQIRETANMVNHKNYHFRAYHSFGNS